MKLLHLGRKVGLAVALALCLLHLAVSTLAAEPLPVDILWQSRLNRLPGNLGPCWSDSGHAYISLFGNDTLVILRNGELVRRAVLGDLLAIDRGDVYPNIEGVEFIVALDEGNTHEVVILNGSTLQEISSFTAANEANAYERVSALKWVGGDVRKILVGIGQTEVTHREVHGLGVSIFHWFGRTDIYDGDSFDIVANINTREVNKFIQLGSDILVFGAEIDGELVHAGQGDRTVGVTPSITVLDSHLRFQQTIELSQITQNTTVAGFRAGRPIWFQADFACLEDDSTDILMLSYSGEFDPRFCMIDNQGWRGDWRVRSINNLSFITTIIPIRTNAGSVIVDYVLCHTAYFGTELIFFNPYNYAVSLTDYTSPFEDFGLLEGADFDGDGRTELIGYLDGRFTCARPQQLAVVDDPAILHPSSLILTPPFPNPFNSTTTITFGLDKSAPTRLAVYDLQGRLVRELTNERMASGTHKIIWDAGEMPNSIYLIKLSNGIETKTAKVLLIK